MSELTLVIGSKRLSSWSLRAWLAMTATGAPFDEIVIPLDTPETHQNILAQLAERFPEAGLWPADGPARAHARAVAAEMHAGFAALREHLPFACVERHPGAGRTPETLADIERIAEIWRDCRARFGAGGDFLFGAFGIADCMYAPVVSRFVTYQVPLDDIGTAYVDTAWAHPAMRAWVAAAAAEPA
jgi:glutathione S-transferase